MSQRDHSDALNDPLCVLCADNRPVQPDPAFAARLRRQLESALSLPAPAERIVMRGTAQNISEWNDVNNTQVPRPAALPYLCVTDARGALDWYSDAFGAVVVGEPIVMDDRRIGHAELTLNGGILYLADEYPELGLRAPKPGAVSVSLMLPVADTDAAVGRAREHGATVVREVEDNHGRRSATIIDPFGHRWILSGPIATPIIQHGDIGYVSLWTPNAERAATFYEHVLGWTYDPATHRVTNTDLPTRIQTSAGPPTLFCCYAVTDLSTARTAITEAGGTVGETRQSEHGVLLDATDSAGRAFAVFEPAPGQKRPELNGSGPGELAYVTYEVSDSATFRDFHARVLQWTFAPGFVPDGWQVQTTHPMAGVGGGNSRPGVVPMWTVGDIDAAVERVSMAGGTVHAEPSRQPYGVSAECSDNQGGRFYLVQF